jgi:hypothetical protein
MNSGSRTRNHPHSSNGTGGKKSKLCKSGVWLCRLLVIALVTAVVSPGIGQALPADPGAIERFFHSMVGEWIGTLDQSTDQVKAPIKYFHALVKRTGPDSYKTVFEYYKLDPETREPVDAGTSIMVTRIAPGGSGTNTITGPGGCSDRCQDCKAGAAYALRNSPNVFTERPAGHWHGKHKGG